MLKRRSTMSFSSMSTKKSSSWQQHWGSVQAEQKESSLSRWWPLADWTTWSPVLQRSRPAATDSRSERRTAPHSAPWTSCWPPPRPAPGWGLKQGERGLNTYLIKELKIPLLSEPLKLNFFTSMSRWNMTTTSTSAKITDTYLLEDPPAQPPLQPQLPKDREHMSMLSVSTSVHT